MPTPLFTLIGMGDDGPAGIPDRARRLISDADVIIASKRLLATIPNSAAELVAWPSPFDPLMKQLKSPDGKRVVILATGDPMWFGAGSTLVRHFCPSDFEVIPAPSAFSLAAARLGWPLQDVETVSLHGRPASTIIPHLRPGARLIVLTSGTNTLEDVCRKLVEAGLPASPVTILEHMGGDAERRIDLRADDNPLPDTSGFYTLAVQCVPGKATQIYAQVPGLPDDAFLHDGQLTKREVRAVTLSALCPCPGALLWDVGAGCGSIAIEWLRAERTAQALAFERAPQRLTMITENAERLGTPHIAVVAGDLPGTLAGKAPPDAVFWGGAVHDVSIFNACWSALKPGGRLVANAVTLEGEAQLLDLQSKYGGDLVRVAVSKLTEVGTRRGMRPHMTVTQWRITKT